MKESEEAARLMCIETNAKNMRALMAYEESLASDAQAHAIWETAQSTTRRTEMVWSHTQSIEYSMGFYIDQSYKALRTKVCCNFVGAKKLRI